VTLPFGLLLVSWALMAVLCLLLLARVKAERLRANIAEAHERDLRYEVYRLEGLVTEARCKGWDLGLANRPVATRRIC